MTQQEKEMNMDSAPGAMETQAVDKGAMGGAEPGAGKTNLPQGEQNPQSRLIKNLPARQKHTENLAKNRGLSFKDIADVVDDDKAIALSNDSHLKRLQNAEAILNETTMSADRALAEDMHQKNEAWINQNPWAADAHGMSAHHAMNAGNPGPAMKRLKAHIDKRNRGHRSPLHFNGQQTQFTAGNANMAAQNMPAMRKGDDKAFLQSAQALQDSIQQFDQWYGKRKQAMDNQKKREARDANSNEGAMIQQANSQPGIGAATEKLMALQWKQRFAEINKMLAEPQPGISREQAETEKNQLLQNANTYAAGRDSLVAQAQQFQQMAKQGMISDGTPVQVRDLLNTVANNKGKSLAKVDDSGKMITKDGLTVMNVGGAPTLLGYTEGQIETLQGAYQQQVAQNPQMAQMSFDQWMTTIPTAFDNPEEYQNLPQVMGDEIGKAAQGVNIPMSNLADGTAGLNVVQKSGQAVKGKIEELVQGLHNDAIYGNQGEYAHLPASARWDAGAGEKVAVYISDLVDMMDQNELRGLAADYMNPPILPEEFDALEDSEGIDTFRDNLKKSMTMNVEQTFVPPMEREDLAMQQQLANQAMVDQAAAKLPRLIDDYHMETDAGWVGDLDYLTQAKLAKSNDQIKKYLDEGPFWNSPDPHHPDNEWRNQTQDESGDSPLQANGNVPQQPQEWWNTPEAKAAFKQADSIMKPKYDEAAKLDPWSAEGESALITLDAEYDQLVQKLMQNMQDPYSAEGEQRLIEQDAMADGQGGMVPSPDGYHAPLQYRSPLMQQEPPTVEQLRAMGFSDKHIKKILKYGSVDDYLRDKNPYFGTKDLKSLIAGNLPEEAKATLINNMGQRAGYSDIPKWSREKLGFDMNAYADKAGAQAWENMTDRERKRAEKRAAKKGISLNEAAYYVANNETAGRAAAGAIPGIIGIPSGGIGMQIVAAGIANDAVKSGQSRPDLNPQSGTASSTAEMQAEIARLKAQLAAQNQQ